MIGDFKEKYKYADKKTIKNIVSNYVQNEESLKAQLYFKAEHGPSIGGFREEIWMEMFRQIIPLKFAIEKSVFIIDSWGHVSNEVDLAIFDETYTPYIFRYKKLKFLPIEAVAAVVECKSTSIPQVSIKKWGESIDALKTSNEYYVRMATKVCDGTKEEFSTQTQTRPLRILCCINNISINSSLASGKKIFDIIVRCLPKEGLKISFDEDKKSLLDWYLELNHAGHDKNEKLEKIKENANSIKEIELLEYEIKKKDGSHVSLLEFNLLLNQILMLINNPIFFPHKVYAELFDFFAKKGDVKK